MAFFRFYNSKFSIYDMKEDLADSLKSQDPDRKQSRNTDINATVVPKKQQTV
jgi:hypothetical protein